MSVYVSELNITMAGASGTQSVTTNLPTPASKFDVEYLSDVGASFRWWTTSNILGSVVFNWANATPGAVIRFRSQLLISLLTPITPTGW